MTTQGGGWTLTFKQSDFDSAITLTDAVYAGDPLLVSETFNGTTQGSIVGLVNHTQTLFKNDAATWVHVEESILDWTKLADYKFCLSQVELERVACG
jgi:hypothetical protein